AKREHGHLRIPSLLMRARALATVRAWKKRLEHQAHSRLTSEAPAGFQSRRGLSYDDSAPVSPHNAPFPTYKAPAGFQSRRGLSYDDSAPVSPHNAPFPTYKAISPICDRCKSTFNFALNGGRFALPVDGPHNTKE